MGGSNETTTGATTRNGTGNDSTLGSSINLRGLGTNSTLVLIDGARPALGGTGGLFADISLIPMTAVERIEVLTDGASAIYGADRSEEHTSELQSLMRISYAVFCLKKKT